MRRSDNPDGPLARVEGRADFPGDDEKALLISYFASLAPLATPHQLWQFAPVGHTWQLRLDSSVELQESEDHRDNIRAHIACGAAIEFARLAMRALGYAATVRLTPRPDDVDLLATLTEGHRQRPTPVEERLIKAITEGSSAAGTHELTDMPALFLAELHENAADRGCWLRVLDADDHEVSSVARLLSEPHLHGARSNPAYRGSGTFVLLGTDRDDPQSWLRVGRSLASLVLALAAGGLVAHPLRLVSEAQPAVVRLRQRLRLIGCPQVLIQVDSIGDRRPRSGPGQWNVPLSRTAA